MRPHPSLSEDDFEGFERDARAWLEEVHQREAEYEKARAAFELDLAQWCQVEDPGLMTLDRVFYHLCRNGLCHEGGIDRRVRLFEANGLVVKGLDPVEMSVGWINQLAILVVYADVNAGLFSEEEKTFWRTTPSFPEA